MCDRIESNRFFVIPPHGVFPTQMSLISLFALPSGLEITTCSKLKGRLCVSLLSTQPCSHCPLCGSAATRIHSRDPRKLADLPSAGQSVRFLLLARKFFCEVPACPRKIFAERLLPFVAPWARVAARLFQLVQIIGLATGGRLGVRVTDRMSIQTSKLTILRRIMALPTGPTGPVIQLGIDDFSFKRGRTFGTILVNLQTHQVIDVLADRKAETSATWMASHPEIQLVSRDRAGDYASAAASGAPQATQCADRFHLLQNLGEALEGVLARHQVANRTHLAQESRATPLSTAQPGPPPTLSPKAAQHSQAKREERLARYQHVVALHKLGFSQTAIANQVGIGHATVSRWLEHGTFPEQQLRPRKTGLDSHLSFLRERWEAGCHNIAQLYRELVARGYTQSYESVYEQLARLRAIREEERSKGMQPLSNSSVLSAGDVPLPSSI
jgi:transposase